MNNNDWKWQDRLGFVFFAIATFIASSAIGFVFGWVSGSSITPIVATIAPLILGLLAGLGLTTALVSAPTAIESLPAFLSLGEREKSKIKSELASIPNYWHRGVVALALFGFAACCDIGLRKGALDRADPFPVMVEPIPSWGNVDIETRRIVYDIRWKLQKSGKRGSEFKIYAKEVIGPILTGMKTEEKRAKLTELLDNLPE